ncbi:MAG TPA: hypothetical protein VKE92_15640 [Anaerolineales bacterium]|nr:hypothetical protein [Anaerolineales bacterium]
MQKDFTIHLYELPGHLQRRNMVWQADCGNNHARGKTAGSAVQNLVKFIWKKSALVEKDE